MVDMVEMKDMVGMVDTVVVTVVKARKYGLGSMLFDLGICSLAVIAVSAVLYFKVYKRWRSKTGEHTPSQPDYWPSQ